MDNNFGRFQPQEDSRVYKKKFLEEESPSDSEGSVKKFKVFENSEDEEEFEEEGKSKILNNLLFRPRQEIRQDDRTR